MIAERPTGRAPVQAKNPDRWEGAPSVGSEGTPRSPDLPTPAVDGLDDSLAALYKLLIGLRDQGAARAHGDATSNREAQRVAEESQQQALAEARRHAEAGGVFQWLSDDIGVVGVVGLATFQYGLVAADLALHKTGLVENLRLDVVDGAALASGTPELLVADLVLRKTELTPTEVEKMLDDVGLGRSVPGIEDADVKPVVETAIKMNLFVAGAATSVLTAGTTTALVIACIGLALSTGSMVSSAAGGPDWLTIGLGVGGITASLGAGLANAGTVTKLGINMGVAKSIAAGVNGTSGALNGADTLMTEGHRYGADRATIDATAARHALARLERLFTAIVDGLRATETSHQRTSAVVSGIVETRGQTLLQATQWKA